MILCLKGGITCPKTEHVTRWQYNYASFIFLQHPHFPEKKLPHTGTLESPLHRNDLVSRDITNYDLLILKERKSTVLAKSKSYF